MDPIQALTSTTSTQIESSKTNRSLDERAGVRSSVRRAKVRHSQINQLIRALFHDNHQWSKYGRNMAEILPHVQKISGG